MEDPVDWDEVELNIEVEPASEEHRDYIPSSVFISSPDCTLEMSDEDMNSSERSESSDSDVVHQDDKSSIYCFLCKSEFTKKEDLVSHLKTAHKCDTRCILCKEDFTSVLVLLVHIDMAHTSRNWICCFKICSLEAKMSTSSPFIYIRHRILTHFAEIPSTENVEVTFSCQKEFLFVCHFCKTGLRRVDNVFLHLVYIHRIDWDMAFVVAAKHGMLHKRNALRCLKCPKTMDDSGGEHCRLECEHFAKNYSLFTAFCRECHVNLKRHNFELRHFYCLQPSCLSIRHRTRVEKGQRVPFNIVYAHGRGTQISCQALGQKPFTCPECFKSFSTFSDLSEHYLHLHESLYGRDLEHSRNLSKLLDRGGQAPC